MKQVTKILLGNTQINNHELLLFIYDTLFTNKKNISVAVYSCGLVLVYSGLHISKNFNLSQLQNLTFSNQNLSQKIHFPIRQFYLPQVFRQWDMSCPGGHLNIKMSSYQYRDPMLKIRRSCDRLIFNMGIPIPGKDGLYIETGSWSLFTLFTTWQDHTHCNRKTVKPTTI